MVSQRISQWAGPLPIGVILLLIVAVMNASPSNGGTGDTMNIESIGGWNVWVWLTFFLLSQSVIVHHLRQISKSLRILVDSQQKEQG